MASSSGFIGFENETLSNMEDEIQWLFPNQDIPKCKGVPRHLWTTKCVSLYNNDRIVVQEGICYSVKSNLVVKSTGPLGDVHVAV
jgi:hypothetical protein